MKKGKLSYSKRVNNVIIEFNGKPPAHIRRCMKSAGFCWSPVHQVWYLRYPPMFTSDHKLINDPEGMALSIVEDIADFDREKVLQDIKDAGESAGVNGMLEAIGII